MWYISTAIWFYENNKVGVKRIIELIVDAYIERLNSKIYVKPKKTSTITAGNYNLWKAYHENYVPRSVEQRNKDVNGPVINEVQGILDNKKKDRTEQKTLKKMVLQKHNDVIDQEQLGKRVYVYPLSSNGEMTPVTVNFATSINLQFLHPNDDENKAEDGFLGLTGDNLIEPFKSQDWSHIIKGDGSNYWKLVVEHNYDKLESLKEDDKIMYKKVKRGIETLEALADSDLSI